MKVLFLGYADSPVLAYLQSVEDEVISTMDIIDLHYIRTHQPDFIVSYRYRHLVQNEVLECFPGRAVNLHISYLPWNRGADPHLWCHVDNTPMGVTIHYMDKGLDTGDIIVQQEVTLSDLDTLKTAYDKLHQAIQALFMQHWPNIRTGQCLSFRQTGKGSFHRIKDKETLSVLFAQGWDTPIAVLKKQARQIIK